MPTDDSDLNDLTNALQTGAGVGGSLAANGITQAAYASMLQNLQNRFNDYANLGPAGYKNITAQQLGPSQLGSIAPNAQDEAQQQEAISELQDIQNRGGLNLSDQAALDQIQAQLNQNNSARANATANQYAARGELGSGAQMAMDLANNQNAATTANAAGQSAAAQAQQRAMQAVLQKAQASRTMENDQYARQAAAASANDAIAQHNANYATDAGKYNNTLAGQSFQDQLSKLKGETTLTGDLNNTLLGSANGNANTVKGLAQGGSNLLGGLGSGGSSGGSGGSGSSTDSGDDGGTGAGYGGGGSTVNDPGGVGQTAQDVGTNPETDDGFDDTSFD